MNICKNCVHYHDDVKELPFWKRIFVIRTEFSETCDLPQFQDPVDGSRYPCITARVSKCSGLPPMFQLREDKNHEQNT